MFNLNKYNVVVCAFACSAIRRCVVRPGVLRRAAAVRTVSPKIEATVFAVYNQHETISERRVL